MLKKLPLKTIIKNIFTMPLGTPWNVIAYEFKKIDVSKYKVRNGQVVKRRNDNRRIDRRCDSAFNESLQEKL